MADQLAKQTQLQRSITNAVSNFKKLGRNNLTMGKIQSRITALNQSWDRFQESHWTLLSDIPAEEQATLDYFNQHHFDTTEEEYRQALDFMTECQLELESSVSAPPDSEQTIEPSKSAFSLSHLPPINLPPFSGNYDEWEHFRDRFTSLIRSNKDLSSFARMHYLTSCLTGPALQCIANLPVTSESFDVAWQTLTERFEDKNRLLNRHLASILNLPSLTRESASDIHNLRDRVRASFSALERLNRTPAELWGDISVYVVSSKLDTVTRKAWNLRSGESTKPPSFEDLDKFLAARARAIDASHYDSPTMPPVTAKPPAKASCSVRVSASSATATTSFKCSLCEAKHYLSTCPKFLCRSPNERRELARKANHCFNCLCKNHSAPECRSQYTCRVCHQKHHTLLHSAFTSTPKGESAVSTAQSPEAVPSSIPKSVSASAVTTMRPQILLATAWVSVTVPPGRSVVVRALLDQGSQMTFITENLAQMLSVKRFRMPTEISAVGGVSAGLYHHAAHIQISPRNESHPTVSTTALILKTLSAYSPKSASRDSFTQQIRDLPLADQDPTSSEPISLLIGADLYNEILLSGIRKGAAGTLLAQNTIFGWVLSGPLRISCNNASPSTHGSPLVTPLELYSHHCLQSIPLDQELRRFWETEEVSASVPRTPQDEQCEQHFLETHSRNADGRYIVRLPFKTGPPIDIGESFIRAQRVLKSLYRRLLSCPAQHVEYATFLQEYEQLGHMSEVSALPVPNFQSFYIPHHPVIRDSSATTRLRVVFNASSLSTNGSSLNDHLLTGPKLQADLPSILLQWRQYRYVYAADIKQMYRQILIDPRDVSYQRILWSSSASEPPRIFQLQTVTYGTASAPFLALRVLKQLAVDEGRHFPLALPILSTQTYVDDVLFGADDPDQLRETRKQLCGLLSRGKFELRKWASNSSDLLTDIDSRDHGLACNKVLQDNDRLTILGIGWNPLSDTFEFRVSLDTPAPETKRSILSLIAKLFDPLGWVTPVIIHAKILMQSLWRLNLDWDDLVPDEQLVTWRSIYSHLSCLNGVQIPRWTGQGSQVIQLELHGFADASSVAFAAVVYLRVLLASGEVKVTLLAGKSKVAPVATLSIPRLELSAAVLLARLITSLKSSVSPQAVPCTCWTDSTVVLCWLQQHPSQWKTFVANRVSEVQSLLPNVVWRHVPTAENPADCASRGMTADQLMGHILWWQGPSWLTNSATAWPVQPITPNTGALDLPERKIVGTCGSTPRELWDLSTRFSSWTRLISVTAYVLRFVQRCRRQVIDSTLPDNTLALSAQECALSKSFWYKQLQAHSFESEIRALANNRPISSKSSILSLNPFLDDEGLLRVGGRLNEAPLPFAQKHPIIFVSHGLVKLLVSHIHVRMLHSGLKLTLATLRREFWIVRARDVVKGVLRRCVRCARENATTPTQLMGNLPAVRVSAPSRPFLHCGLDYAGPMLVRASGGRGIKSVKSYIAVFVCLATKAIHLELVGSYSAQSFLDAFSRFCARRGLPQSMYSDNGTNFVGADRELHAAYSCAVQNPEFLNSTAADNVSWHFIPPSAPHFGGLWEAGVRSVKYHLRRVLESHTLTYEEFTTLLCRIEACLNSRPLAPIHDSADDFHVLTPAHFLIGNSLTLPPEPSVLDVNENRLSRWQLVRHITEKFWKLWQTDYLNSLQQRGKWRTLQPQIKVGQLVWLRNSSLPPCKWEIGIVTRCHPGPDHITRVVSVKTPTSEYKRPLAKVCLLPVDIDSSDQEKRSGHH